MRLVRLLLLAALTGSPLGAARAADPVTVELKETASATAAVVTVGDVASVTGGDPFARARVARIDLVELRSREPSATVGRKSVEYRLLLAGINGVRVVGAERAVVTLARRSVTTEEVVSAARAELLRSYQNPESLKVELAVPVLAKLPEVPLGEKVVITAKPRGAPGATGRVQVDVTIAAGGDPLLSLGVQLNVQTPGLAPIPPLGPLTPTPAAAPAGAPPPAPGAAVASADGSVRAQQRVEIQVNSGGIKASTVGVAQQPGKIGQTILVQNLDSKKTISARVTGPTTVEVDLGGSK
ncbi:MAG: flagella basal body P-ring formation protein FlgA [Gemmata sp.]